MKLHTTQIIHTKVGSDKSIPIMKSLETTFALLAIQYDTGCQYSLISKSALQLLPADSYSPGNFSRMNHLNFTGQGQLFEATEVKLNLYNLVLNLWSLMQIWTVNPHARSLLLTSGGRTQVTILLLTPAGFPFCWVVTIS